MGFDENDDTDYLNDTIDLKKLIKKLINICEAQQKLLACYRIGKRPSEKILNDCSRVDSILTEARGEIQMMKFTNKEREILSILGFTTNGKGWWYFNDIEYFGFHENNIKSFKHIFRLLMRSEYERGIEATEERLYNKYNSILDGLRGRL